MQIWKEVVVCIRGISGLNVSTDDSSLLIDDDGVGYVAYTAMDPGDQGTLSVCLSVSLSRCLAVSPSLSQVGRALHARLSHMTVRTSQGGHFARQTSRRINANTHRRLVQRARLGTTRRTLTPHTRKITWWRSTG